MHYTIHDILDTDAALPNNVLAFGTEEHYETYEPFEGDDGKTLHAFQEHHNLTVHGFGIEGKGWMITGQLPEQDFDADIFLDAVKAKVGAAVFNKHVGA